MSNVQHLEAHDGKVKPDYLASWEEFLIKDHLKIWRRPLQGTHLYEYKGIKTWNSGEGSYN